MEGCKTISNNSLAPAFHVLWIHKQQQQQQQQNAAIAMVSALNWVKLVPILLCGVTVSLTLHCVLPSMQALHNATATSCCYC
jgi:hypothetical protein